MRALVILVEVAIVLFVAYLVFAGISALTRGRPTQLPPGGRWQPRHFAADGDTVVTVARVTPRGDVLEEHVVARIPDADADWSRRFLAAMQEAEERAFHLNTGAGP